jgi:hypothetical protein
MTLPKKTLASEKLIDKLFIKNLMQRTVMNILRGKPTLEGAGVRLNSVFGYHQVSLLGQENLYQSRLVTIDGEKLFTTNIYGFFPCYFKADKKQAL